MFRFRRRSMCFALAGAVLVMAAALPEARAAGMLISEGGFGGVLEIQEQTAHVTINNGVAVTEVTQVFRNTENRQVEALYLFPVPKAASVANFSRPMASYAIVVRWPSGSITEVRLPSAS